MGETGGTSVGDRLRERRDEISSLIFSRIAMVAPLPGLIDDEYVRGLERAVSTAIDFAISALELGVGRTPPIPAELLTQARLAAGNQVSLESVLRRYIAGHSIVGQFLIEELADVPASERRSTKGAQQLYMSLIDRIVDPISDAYRDEASTRARTTKQQELNWVKRLLEGESLFAERFAYDFDRRQVGVVAAGLEVSDAIHALSEALDARLLLVQPTDVTAWAWLAIQDEPDWAVLDVFLDSEWPRSAQVGIGDAAEGMAGWRLTHGQARAAASTARRLGRPSLSYRLNSLQIAVLSDDAACDSLRKTYLDPLARDRPDGALQRTVRAYMRAGYNANSAAHAIGVSRQTVGIHLRRAEELIGRPLTECGTHLDVALWLGEAERRADSLDGESSGADS